MVLAEGDFIPRHRVEGQNQNIPEVLGRQTERSFLGRIFRPRVTTEGPLVYNEEGELVQTTIQGGEVCILDGTGTNREVVPQEEPLYRKFRPGIFFRKVRPDDKISEDERGRTLVVRRVS